MCNEMTVTYKNGNDYKGGYIWIFSAKNLVYVE